MIEASERTTLDVLLLISDVQAWIRYHGSERAARRAARRLADQLPIGTGTRAAVWWWAMPDVPDDLRGTGSITDLTDDDLSRARTRWLVTEGRRHLVEDEEEQLRSLGMV